MLRQSLALLLMAFGANSWHAQGITAGDSTAAATPSYQTVDGIVAVIGDEIVLASDIRERVTQAQLEGRTVTEANKCGLLESLLF